VNNSLSSLKPWLLLALASALAIATLNAQAQKPLTNDDVIKLAQAGFGDEVIQKAIQAHAPAFDISPEALSALKKAGVSEKMIAAILDRQSQAPVTPPPPAPVSTPATPTPTPPPAGATPPIAAVKEISPTLPDVPSGAGVFYKADGKWVQMPMAPQAETKGIGMKSLIAHSTVMLTMPKATMFYPGKNSTVQLSGRPIFGANNLGALGIERNARVVRLKIKKDSRELEGRGKSLDISVERISEHLFTVAITEDLKPGEYLLHFGQGSAAYDFGIARK